MFNIICEKKVWIVVFITAFYPEYQLHRRNAGYRGSKACIKHTLAKYNELFRNEDPNIVLTIYNV